jgi:predicted amidohydrolase
MSKRFTVACVQVTAGQDVTANVDAAVALARQARDAGAEFILLPENVALMEPKTEVIRGHAVAAEDHPLLTRFGDLARELDVWLLAGSLPTRSPDGRIANCSTLLDPNGDVVRSYDKIHMFDVDLPSGESYRESKTYQPGEEGCLAELPWGVLGMTVCYDLRFPQLYRSLAQAGAQFLSVPAAFTKVTGEAHWHVLLRARAIENGCFVLAPTQCGLHYGTRRTYGHSLIIDPWGEVLADGGDEVGIITAEIDPAKVDEVRAMIPSLGHDRPFSTPRSGRARISAVS